MNKEGPWILLVDDSPTSRVMIGKQLGRLGCQVAYAEDGRSALAALDARPYQLVLLDCYLPDINGYEVARRLRAREGDGAGDGGYTPLIGISAEADAAHVRLCLDSGMDGILGKPLPLEELKTLLALWCDYDAGESPDGGELQAQADDVAPDLEALFHSTSLQDLQDMRRAHETADLAALRRLAHRMKGAALILGRAQLVAQLERIEAAARDGGADADRAAIDTLVAALEISLSA